MPFIALTSLLGKFGSHILDYIPFLLMVRGDNEGDFKVKLDVNAVLNAIVIAVVTAAITGWALRGDIQHLRENMDKGFITSKEEIHRIDVKVEKIFSDIYRVDGASSK